jgi:6-phosphogluconolactonase
MSENQMQSFADRGALDLQLAADIVDCLAAAIEARGAATMAVSGGSTPQGLFTVLSEQDLDWSKVTITLVDDRWVPPAHVDSNELLVNTFLRVGRAAASTFVSLHSAHGDPHDAQPEIEERLQVFGTIDVMMLGMGGDGHFASLFPDSDVLEAGLDLAGTQACIAVYPPVAPHARMSMTLPRIFDSRFLILHITGDDKLAVLERARRDGDPLALPIAAVLGATDPGARVYWAP